MTTQPTPTLPEMLLNLADWINITVPAGTTSKAVWLGRVQQAAVEADRQGRMPSDEELLKWAGEEQFFLFCDEDEFLQIAREVLSRYSSGQPAHTPCDAGEICIDCQPRRPDGSCPDGPAASAKPSQITDAMVDAYLKAQADVIRKVDDMWGNGGKAASYLQPVRESCRAGLQAALGVAAPVAQEPVLVGWTVGVDGGGILHAAKYTEDEAKRAGYPLAVYRLVRPKSAPVAAQAQPSAQDREDAERMDWLDRVAHCADWLDGEPTKRVIRASDGAEFTGDTWREAIDAARAA